jgi:hypothetical protein
LTYFADHSELLSNWSRNTGRLRFRREVQHGQRWQFTLQDVLVRPNWPPDEAPDGAPVVNPDVGLYAFAPDPERRAAIQQRHADGEAWVSPLMTLAPFRREGRGPIIARYEVMERVVAVPF